MSERPRKRAKIENKSASHKRKAEEIAKGKSDDAFVLMLAKTKVDDILPAKDPIVTASREDSLPSVLKKLIQKNILSAPVFTKGNDFYGFIDVLDIITWIVDKIGEMRLTKSDSFDDIISEFNDTLVKDVIRSPYSRRNPYHPITTGSSLLSAAEVLSKGTHRVPVVDESTKDLLNIVTQSSLVHFINTNVELLGSKKDTKVSSLGQCFTYVLTVDDTDRAIDAFRLIRYSSVGAVAVVDKDNKIVGNLSARDIKKISHDAKYFERLFENVQNFRDNRRLPHVTVTEEDTVETVLNLLDKHKIHRDRKSVV